MNLERIIEEFHQGHSLNAYEVFGAHFVDEGVRFTVYAPHAENVGSLDHLQTGMRTKS